MCSSINASMLSGQSQMYCTPYYYVLETSSQENTHVCLQVVQHLINGRFLVERFVTHTDGEM